MTTTIDGWAAARTIATWLDGQHQRMALRQIDRLEARARKADAAARTSLAVLRALQEFHAFRSGLPVDQRQGAERVSRALRELLASVAAGDRPENTGRAAA